MAGITTIGTTESDAIAGMSFDATTVLGFDIEESDSENIQNGVAFYPTVLNAGVAADLETYLGIKQDKLAYYDGDTVNGFAKIVEAMKAVENGNPTTAQTDLLKKADDFFDKLFECCKGDTVKLDGSYTAGAASVYQAWVTAHADDLGINDIKNDTNEYLDKLHLDTFEKDTPYFSEDQDGDLDADGDSVSVFDKAYKRAGGTPHEHGNHSTTPVVAARDEGDAAASATAAGGTATAGRYTMDGHTPMSGTESDFTEQGVFDFMDSYGNNDFSERLKTATKDYTGQGGHYNNEKYFAEVRAIIKEFFDAVAAEYEATGDKSHLEGLATILTQFHHVQFDDNGGDGNKMLHAEKGSLAYALGHMFQGALYQNNDDVGGMKEYVALPGLMVNGEALDVNPYDEGGDSDEKDREAIYEGVLAYLTENAADGKLSDNLGTTFKGAGGHADQGMDGESMQQPLLKWATGEVDPSTTAPTMSSGSGGMSSDGHNDMHM